MSDMSDSKKITLEKLLALPLLGRRFKGKLSMTRVPGGWVYETYDEEGLACAFIPEPSPETKLTYAVARATALDNIVDEDGV